MTRTIISKRAVLALVPFGPRTLERQVRDGRFPPPVLVSDRMPGWYADEVDAWLASRPRKESADAVV